MIEKYSKKASTLALTPVIKSLRIKISSAISFHGRELKFVPKCSQMNKLSCGKKINGGLVWKKNAQKTM